MTTDEIKAKVESALARLIAGNHHLFVEDVHERTIAAHFARYLQDQFPNWNVDPEYNRNLGVPKRLKGTDNTVFPDIIIHKRGSRENLLVIAVKKTTSRETPHKDYRILRAFKEEDEFKYQHALFICFRTGGADFGVEKAEWV